MKSLTKKALVLIFAAAIIFSGIFLIATYSKEFGSKKQTEQIEQIVSGLNAGPTGGYASNTWFNYRASSYAGGRGSATNAYKIANEEQLALMAYNVNYEKDSANSYYELTADINLSAHYWIPIGTYNSLVLNGVTVSQGNSFSGFFNGAGYTIRGVYIGHPDSGEDPKLEYAGLFGYASGRVENLKLECFIKNTGTYIGSIVGYANGLTLNYCTVISDSKISNTSASSSRQTYIGGLVGYVNNSTLFIDYCFNYADISYTGPDSSSYQGHAGGLFGCAVGNTTMTHSGNFGRIETYLRVGSGGLAARMKGTVDSCFNEGDINSKSTISNYADVGGLVGWPIDNLPLDNMTIKNSYNTGDIYVEGIAGTAGYGGLVGYEDTTKSNIENCFTSGNIVINNTEKRVGIISGNGNPTLINCYYNSKADLRRNNANYPNPGVGKPGYGEPITRIGGEGSATDFNTFPAIQDFIAELNKNKESSAEWDDKNLSAKGFPTFKYLAGLIENDKEGTVTFFFNYPDSYNGPVVDDRQIITKLLNQNNYIESSEIEKPSIIAYEFIQWIDLNDSSVYYAYNSESVFVDNNGNKVTIDDLNGKMLYAKWEAIEYIIIVENTINSSDDSYLVTFENKDIFISADAISAGAAEFFSFMNWEVWNSADNGGIDDYIINYNLSEKLNISEILTLSFITANAYLDSISQKTTIKFRAVFADENTKLCRLTVKSNYQSYGSVKINGTLIPYDAAIIKETGKINIAVEVTPYYDFVSFNINGNTVTNQIITDFDITEDTDIVVTFKRHEYNILISSQYDTGGGAISSPLAFVGGQLNTTFRIGDIIRVTYKTNVDGFKFLSIKLSDIELDRSGFGMFELEITPDILACLEGSELKLVAVYSQQYSFSINLSNSTNDNYYALEAYYGEYNENTIFANSIYYLDYQTNVTIKVTPVFGYKISSVSGLAGYSIDDLLNSIILQPISDAWDITIEILPIEYAVNLSAKWIDETIDEIDFSTGKSFTLEYNGKTENIIKFDISRYKFDGWYIRHWESSKFIKLSGEYVDANGNLKTFTYQYLKDLGYIDDNLGVEIVASYIPVYNITVNVAGFWDYEVKIDNEVENNFKQGQYVYGTIVVITVKHSDYINFKLTLNGSLQNIQDILNNGFYVLELDFNNVDYIVNLDFEQITKTLNITENLSGAKGSYDLKGGERNGNELKIKYGNTLTFTFETASGQTLNEWTIKGSTVMTADELVEKGWAARSGNILTLYLNKEDALNWLTGSSEMAVTIGTIFNPLFTALIAVGSVLIIALAIFITLYAVSANKKKKKIKAAVEAGIIGAARFKTSFHEDI